MPIYFDNTSHVGNKGIFYTKANCIPLTISSIITSPAISGTAQVGQTLTCSSGTYSGTQPIIVVSYVWSWYGTSTIIQSGSSNTYVIQSGDAGKQIICNVTVNNCGGIPLSSYSNYTSVIPTPISYLFDVFATYGVTPRAAFSLRLLNGSYTGACCRIRRSNDNAETDIGFVSGVVDVAAIQAFVPIGASGQIVYVYDQSGNGRHRYESVANRQPDIIDSAGVVKTQNGKTAIHLNNSLRMLQDLNTTFPLAPSSTPLTFFNVYKATTSGSGTMMIYTAGTNQYGWVAQSGSAALHYNQMSNPNNTKNNSIVTMSTRQQVYTLTYNAPNLMAHYGEVQFDATWSNKAWFGGYANIGGGGFEWIGYYMEEIWLDGSQVSNAALCTAVYSNQQSYYTL